MAAAYSTMAPQIYIHIGLHKTATRFLQRSVFAHLDRKAFNHNPQPLTDLLYRHLRNPDDQSLKQRFDDACASVLQQDTRKLLISLPDISGDMYNSHDNAWQNLELIKTKFAQARILYFVRDQADWLLSAYRQSIQKGVFGPLEVFLNFYDGDFKPKTAQRRGGMRNVDARGLKLWAIYQAYAEAYGADNVYLIRYEDFRANRDAVVRWLAEWLQVPSIPVHRDGKTRHNRSFSALAIRLFCGGRTPPKSPPKAADRLSAWQKTYSPVRLLRNLRRVFIRKVFDRIIYKDWDLLARNGMRETLERHYQDENKLIAQAARQCAVSQQEKT